MIHGSSWQITKQVQEISYPASRPTQTHLASYSLGTKGYFIQMGNQKYCSWDMNLTTPFSIELKIEIYVHPPYALMACVGTAVCLALLLSLPLCFFAAWCPLLPSQPMPLSKLWHWLTVHQLERSAVLRVLGITQI